MDDDDIRREIVKTAATAAATEVADHIGDYVELPILGEGAKLLLPRVVGLALPAYARGKQRQLTKWYDALVRESGDDAAKVKAQYYENVMKDPAIARTMVNCANVMLDAEDECIAPTLAALGAYYAKRGGPDFFFRALCRVLKELSAPMFASFRLLVQMVGAAPLQPLPSEALTMMPAVDVRFACWRS